MSLRPHAFPVALMFLALAVGAGALLGAVMLPIASQKTTPVGAGVSSAVCRPGR
jgi:hypothetical protein